VRRRYSNLLFVLFAVAVCAAQEVRVPGPPPPQPPALAFSTTGDIPVSIERPKMTPELTLHVFQQRARQQASELSSYSAVMVIDATLPDTQQKGEYEVTRTYEAPATLKFKGVRFTGDSFVKTNVITRVLQSEVEHTAPEKMAASALNSDNYKFEYRSTGELNGRAVHIYAVKPRHKAPGLFKGHMAIDATTGSIVHAEGEVEKSPSAFVKKIQFSEDFVDIGSFTFPVRMHSTAKARIIGHTVVDISLTDYVPTALTPNTAAVVPVVTLPNSN
jgi:hypothetical protein